VYVAVEPVPNGPPVGVVQEIPLTPVTDQVPVPVGVAPPVGPATVAVKVKVDPSAAVGLEVATVTIGALCEITIWNGLGESEAAT
jgi:hypothetical protein